MWCVKQISNTADRIAPSVVRPIREGTLLKLIREAKNINPEFDIHNLEDRSWFCDHILPNQPEELWNELLNTEFSDVCERWRAQTQQPDLKLVKEDVYRDCQTIAEMMYRREELESLGYDYITIPKYTPMTPELRAEISAQSIKAEQASIAFENKRIELLKEQTKVKSN